MPTVERKRLDVSMEPDLYLRLKRCAVIEGRSLNAQIGWLLDCALIDWQERADSRQADMAARQAEMAARRTP